MIRRRAATLALTAVTAIAACGGEPRPPPPPAEQAEPADLPGLRAAIDRARAAIDGAADPRAAAAAVIAGWRVPAAGWPALVGTRFRPHHAAYLRAFAQASPALADELIAIGRPAGVTPAPPTGAAIDVRWQYADDPALRPDQARLRVALPVGRPGAIVLVDGRPLSPIFAHDGRSWRALAGLDQLVVRALAIGAPDCLGPYRAAAREPCLAMSAPVIAAALAEDAVGLARACRRLRLHC